MRVPACIGVRRPFFAASMYLVQGRDKQSRLVPRPDTAPPGGHPWPTTAAPPWLATGALPHARPGARAGVATQYVLRLRPEMGTTAPNSESRSGVSGARRRDSLHRSRVLGVSAPTNAPAGRDPTCPRSRGSVGKRRTYLYTPAFSLLIRGLHVFDTRLPGSCWGGRCPGPPGLGRFWPCLPPNIGSEPADVSSPRLGQLGGTARRYTSTTVKWDRR